MHVYGVSSPLLFFGMLRASNLIRSAKSFNAREQLTRRSVVFTDQGILLLINWSKTRKDHSYTHQVSLCQSVEPLLCPSERISILFLCYLDVKMIQYLLFLLKVSSFPYLEETKFYVLRNCLF